MHRLNRIAASLLLVLASLLQPAVAAPEAALGPGSARVWFLRTAACCGDSTGASPMIYADRQPIAAIGESSEFYRDFPAGTYRFTVEPYGMPTGQAQTVDLQPGTTTYLQVSWLSTWQMGYPSDSGYFAHSFFILPMSPHSAVAYQSTLTNLGSR